MVKCWAKTLGGCCNIQSREHYLSKALWEGNEITVKGLWNQTRTVGLQALTAKNLCKTHNELLSPLDSEAKRVFDTITELYRIQEVRQALTRTKKWSVVNHEISGSLFERWTAKFLVGFFYVFGKDKLWHLTQTGPLEPPPPVVEAIFGLKPFDVPMGLYMAYDVGDRHEPGPGVDIAPLFHPDDRGLVGADLEFRGFQFVTWLSKEDPRTYDISLSAANRTFGPSGSELMYHPRKLKFRINKSISQTLEFKW